MIAWATAAAGKSGQHLREKAMAGKGECQTSSFMVKAQLGVEQLPSISCSSDREARQAAFGLFDEHGRDLAVEIYWNNRLLYPRRRMSQFYAQLMRDRHNAFPTR